MRIAIIAAPIIKTPPDQYGGMERITYWLARDLVSRGHNVHLFAREGSYLEGGTVHPFLGGESKEYATLVAEAHNGNYFDIIHDITHDKLLSTEYKYGRILNTLQAMARRGPNTTCISEAQRRELGYGDHVPVIYNRVPTDEYSPIPNPTSDYLLYMGSINDYKGVDICIDVCKKLNQKLVIVGVAWDPPYFDKFVKPQISDNIIWYGEAGGEEKLSLIQNAKALFHPVRWCEAGAIIVSESLSCGVPIIGSNNGILPELVIPAVGRLGSVQHFDNYPHMAGGCYDSDSFVEAVETIGEVSREDCAEYARQFLDASKSTDEYLVQYARLRSGERWE